MQGQSENQSHYSNTEAMGMGSNTGLTNHSSVERHHHQHHHHSHHVNIQPFEIPRVIPSIKAKKAKPERAGLRKAPGAPKRFKSSYILFFMAQQKEIKEELGEGASVSFQIHSFISFPLRFA